MKLSHRKHPHRWDDEVYATQRAPIFVTILTKNSGTALLPHIAPIVIDALREQAERFSMVLHAYCIMPDHVHIVCSVASEESDFLAFITMFKSQVTRQAHQMGRAAFAWRRSYWDTHAQKEDNVAAMIRYVLANPVRKGLCRQ